MVKNEKWCCVVRRHETKLLKKTSIDFKMESDKYEDCSQN